MRKNEAFNATYKYQASKTSIHFFRTMRKYMSHIVTEMKVKSSLGDLVTKIEFYQLLQYPLDYLALESFIINLF